MNPTFILDQAARSARYTEIELAEVSFDSQRPTAAFLSQEWRRIMEEARSVTDTLPWQHVGECILDQHANLLRLEAVALANALETGKVQYHAGSLFGAFPEIVL